MKRPYLFFVKRPYLLLLLLLSIPAVVYASSSKWGELRWGSDSWGYSSAANTVTYSLPYLVTSSDKPAYCIISNLSGLTGISAEFTVMATSNQLSPADRTAHSLGQIASAGQTVQLTFSGSMISVGNSGSVDMSSELGSGGAFGGKLAITAAASSLSYSDFNCLSVPMACFQGDTLPKRNLVGYYCNDGTNVYSF